MEIKKYVKSGYIEKCSFISNITLLGKYLVKQNSHHLHIMDIK